jgi:hypothetical protein
MNASKKKIMELFTYLMLEKKRKIFSSEKQWYLITGAAE